VVSRGNRAGGGGVQKRGWGLSGERKRRKKKETAADRVELDLQKENKERLTVGKEEGAGQEGKREKKGKGKKKKKKRGGRKKERRGGGELLTPFKKKKKEGRKKGKKDENTG